MTQRQGSRGMRWSAIAQLVQAKIVASVAGSLRMAIGDRESARGVRK